MDAKTFFAKLRETCDRAKNCEECALANACPEHGALMEESEVDEIIAIMQAQDIQPKPNSPVFPHILPILQAAIGMSEEECKDAFALIERMFEMLPLGARLTQDHINTIQTVYNFNRGVRAES